MAPQRRGEFELGDYVDVAARIAEFREKHPEGSLQPVDVSRPYEVVTIGDQTWITVVAAAYRAPDDRRPGVGMAYEQYPGRTPYTRGSELQNAETSAWGRAIVAALAADTKRGIASHDEVRNRRAEQDQADEPPTDEQTEEFGRFRLEIQTSSLHGLMALVSEIKSALAAERITNLQNKRLAELWSDRKAELECEGASSEPG